MEIDTARAEILGAAVRAGVQLDELTPEEFTSIKLSLQEKYVNEEIYSQTRGFPRMWKAFQDPLVAVRNPHAWTWIDDFVKDKAEVLLLIDDPTERAIFRFNRGQDVLPVIEDCFGFEFYVTEKSTGFLLCSQRNDYLFALGDAVEWLQRHLFLNSLTPSNF